MSLLYAMVFLSLAGSALMFVRKMLASTSDEGEGDEL